MNRIKSLIPKGKPQQETPAPQAKSTPHTPISTGLDFLTQLPETLGNILGAIFADPGAAEKNQNVRTQQTVQRDVADRWQQDFESPTGLKVKTTYTLEDKSSSTAGMEIRSIRQDAKVDNIQDIEEGEFE